MSAAFKKDERVEFTAGNGKVYRGKYIGATYPAPKAGKHYRIDIGGGVVATIFANGEVGKSMRKVA